MALVQKIDSNVTGLRYAEELTIGVLPGSPVWNPLEPNSYDDFGGELTTVARTPINADRQRKKGVITDLDAAGGFQSDLTQTNLEDILQGFFFADLRKKDEFGGTGEITNVDGINEEYDAASGLDTFLLNNLVEATGFSSAANNGLKVVTVALAASLQVAENLVDETPPAAAKIVQVGHQFAAGDLDIDATGALPKLTTVSQDLTLLGLIIGEWIFLGGDTASLAFVDANNNGFARIRSIATNEIVLDKTAGTMVTEASTSETIQMFFGRVLKNEAATAAQKRRTYNLERQLGAPDDALPAEIQAEYLEGAVPSEITINMTTGDKVTVDMGFIGTDHAQIDGPTALKSGTRPVLVDADAFNTSSDFSRLKLTVLSETDSNPTALFGFVTEFSININNNLSPNKAISVLGAFDVTAGIFEVGGDITAYFSDVDAIASVRNNADVSLDFALVQDNAGIVVDLPLIALGDGKLNIEQDQPITLPLTMAAAADRNYNHTLIMCFFDFLPNAADV